MQSTPPGALELVIGNKNLSSWSLRPWLAMAAVGIPFVERLVLFSTPDFAAKVDSPSSRVPVLKHGDLRVHESIAICEYVHELFPEKQLWPTDRAARARARSISAEMHAGFAELRRECAMDIHGRYAGKEISAGARADIARIQAIFEDELPRRGGPFLYGHFTIADAMYAPVLTRFVTYGVPVSDTVRSYMNTVYALPAMQSWIEGAKRELFAP